MTASPEETNLFVDGHKVGGSCLVHTHHHCHPHAHHPQSHPHHHHPYHGCCHQVEEGEEIVEDWRIHHASPISATTLMVSITTKYGMDQDDYGLWKIMTKSSNKITSTSISCSSLWKIMSKMSSTSTTRWEDAGTLRPRLQDICSEAPLLVTLVTVTIRKT